MSGPNVFPSSTLQLGSLQDADTPSLLDIRSLSYGLRGPDADLHQQMFGELQNAINNIQETLRQASPSLQYLQIDAADIGVLFVGGEYGPGEFRVLNGAPDFADIGWIGSRAKAASVNVSSIVAGLVTSAAAHGLKVGDNVYLEATTDPQNTGFYVVATTPLATTYTVTGGVAGGNSTGGTGTLQFQGIWSKLAAFGGSSYDTAPFQTAPDGSLSIYGGAPDFARIGWIGSSSRATSVTLTSIVAGLVTSAAAHSLKVGDKVYITGTTAALNTGYYIVATTPLTTTFTVTGGVTGGNSTGGTMTKQFQGEWVKMFAAGGTAFDNAPLRIDVDGALLITDAVLTVVHTGTPTTTVSIDPAIGGISVFDDSPIAAITSIGARSVDIKATAGGDLSDVLMFLSPGVAGFSASDSTALVRFLYRTDLGLKLYDAAGLLAFSMDDTVGLSVTKDIDIGGVYKVGGVPVPGMGAPEPDPGTVATSPSISTSNTASTAGGTYTATEQGMLASLKSAVGLLNTDVTNLKAQVDNLITDRNRIRTVLQAHGVMA